MKNIFKSSIAAFIITLSINTGSAKIAIYNNTEYDLYIALVRTALSTQNLAMVYDGKVNAKVLANNSHTLVPLLKNHYIKPDAPTDGNFPFSPLRYNRVLWISNDKTALERSLKNLKILDTEQVQAIEIGGGMKGDDLEVAIQGAPGEFRITKDKKQIESIKKTKSGPGNGQLPQFNPRPDRRLVPSVYTPSKPVKSAQSKNDNKSVIILNVTTEPLYVALVSTVQGEPKTIRSGATFRIYPNELYPGFYVPVSKFTSGVNALWFSTDKDNLLKALRTTGNANQEGIVSTSFTNPSLRGIAIQKPADGTYKFASIEPKDVTKFTNILVNDRDTKVMEGRKS